MIWLSKVTDALEVYRDTADNDIADAMLRVDVTIDLFDADFDASVERETLGSLGLPYKTTHGLGIIEGGKK